MLLVSGSTINGKKVYTMPKRTAPSEYIICIGWSMIPIFINNVFTKPLSLSIFDHPFSLMRPFTQNGSMMRSVSIPRILSGTLHSI